MNLEKIINDNVVATYVGHPRFKITGKVEDTDNQADTLSDEIGAQVAKQLKITARQEPIATANVDHLGAKLLDEQLRNYRKGWI